MCVVRMMPWSVEKGRVCLYSIVDPQMNCVGRLV